MSGVTVSAVALAAPAMLGAAGFGILGPAANSLAAGWQSSTGLVQAGSLFAWCQSAAMGGAAASTIATAGFLGAGVTASATAVLSLGNQFSKSEATMLLEKYQTVFRRNGQITATI